MPTLWVRFADDSALPPTLGQHDRQQLESVFEPGPDALWTRTLRMMGLPIRTVADGWLCWYRDAPYINWTTLAHRISGGSLIPQPDGERFTYRYCYSPAALWGMVKAQWNISRYISTVLQAPLPEKTTDRLVESLALGLCVLALTMRLPSKNATMLQDGLADAAAIPPAFRRVIAQIKALQQRRNQLSSAWTSFFSSHLSEPATDAPAFFWDHPPESPVARNDERPAPTALPRRWEGIPIAGDTVTARAFLVRTKADAEQARASSERLVLIFSLARPDTTELFAHAAAVLYAQGGALSHAASIAREQNLTSMTGLGKEFITAIAQHLEREPGLLLEVNPAKRTVECVE